MIQTKAEFFAKDGTLLFTVSINMEDGKQVSNDSLKVEKAYEDIHTHPDFPRVRKQAKEYANGMTVILEHLNLIV